MSDDEFVKFTIHVDPLRKKSKNFLDGSREVLLSVSHRRGQGYVTCFRAEMKW